MGSCLMGRTPTKAAPTTTIWNGNHQTKPPSTSSPVSPQLKKNPAGNPNLLRLAAMADPSTSAASRVPEDTLFYALYPDPDTSSSSSSSSSSAAAAAVDTFSALRDLHLRLLSLLPSSLRDDGYIWHHDPFSLAVPRSLSSPCPLCRSPPGLSHLHGKLRFGDSIDDEWLAASLLFSLTAAVPCITARLWDSDGEFLLIEAAFALPRWLDPDTAENRVFVRCGELHIVPKSLFPETPSLEAALEAVRDPEVDTRAPDKVRVAISRKISGYPEKALANMHRVRVRVPLQVAQVLKAEPCLISLAVAGFYNRDVDSMKHAAKMEKFLRSRGGEIEMVKVSVRMTRAMYGQLVQQNFQAPGCYPMPSRDEGPAAYVEADLGMKIACGFEMMYQERRQAGEEGKGSTWEAFKQSLEGSGCFQGLLPGSREYQRLLNSALEYYKSSSLFVRTREILSAPVCRIDDILSMPFSAEDFKGIALPPNDDDSWMYNGEEELNSAILERQKELEEYEAERTQRKNRKHKANGNSSSQVSNDFSLGHIAESMQAFVQKVSSFEGADIPDNRSSKAVELDIDQFMKAMESVLGEGSFEGAANDAENEEHVLSDVEFDDSGESDDDDDEASGDEDYEDGFMQSYSDALNEELNASTLKKSFIRAQQQTSNANEGSTSVNEMDGELTSVDVDLNLVQSLLDSFSSQQGLPGPASNLLGLMGVKVPPDTKK